MIRPARPTLAEVPLADLSVRRLRQSPVALHASQQQRPSTGRRPAGAGGRRASGRPRRRPAPRPSRTPRRSRTLRRGQQESPFQSEGRIDRIETHVAGRRATLTGRSSITSPTIRDRTVIQGKSGRQDLNLRPLDPQSSALARLRHAPSRYRSAPLTENRSATFELSHKPAVSSISHGGFVFPAGKSSRQLPGTPLTSRGTQAAARPPSARTPTGLGLPRPGILRPGSPRPAGSAGPRPSGRSIPGPKPRSRRTPPPP